MARVLLLCQDVIGESMAGPAIRYWEFARALSKTHEVTLLGHTALKTQPPEFRLLPRQTTSLAQVMQETDVVVTQIISPYVAWLAKRHGVRMICDAYDPMPLENLEIFKDLPLPLREDKHRHIVNTFNFCFQFADGVICANSRQKDLWIGFSLSQHRITPQTYDSDQTLNHFISTVPFGLSSTLPQSCGESLRSRFNIPSDHKVLLWGGGIWNWFDPLTLIRAIKAVQTSRSDVHLVFMGIKHPNDQVPEMAMASKAIQLAKELNLLDTHVHFNYGWVPYQERQSFLLEADFGVSTHFEHLETRFAFRTRMLDYIWAGLPMLATQGDSFSELIEKHELGITVPDRDVEALTQAIVRLCEDPALVEKMKEQLSEIRSQFYWENVVKPLDRMIEKLRMAPAAGLSISDCWKILIAGYREYSPKRCWNFLKKKLFGKR